MQNTITTKDTEEKSVIITLILNLLLPGAGYAYCGRWFLGIIVLLFVILSFVYTFGTSLFVLVPILIIDSVFVTRRYNRNLSNKPVATS